MGVDQPVADVALRAVRAGDYEYVIARLDEWWGGRSMAPMLPRLFFEQFGPTTVIAADRATDTPVGFLCGFVSATDPTFAYIHFVGVDPSVRRSGLGRALYAWFFDRAVHLGCRRVGCVTSPANLGSRAFHASLGFAEVLVEGYDGTGEPRMSMSRPIGGVDAPPPPDPVEYAAANMMFWNAAAPAHEVSPDYAIERFVDDPAHLSDVVRFDLPRLGDVAGSRGVHLQCHLGTDTISLARLGATMTGLDLSDASLDGARRLARSAGAEIDFVQADTYDAVEVLGGDRFDLAYTGIGALNWLPDIGRWARVVADLLVPGGRLFIREGHPVLWSLADARPDGLLSIAHPYFEGHPIVLGEAGTYAESEIEVPFTWTVEFNHGLGEIIGALITAGMQITSIVEHDSIPWIALAGQMEPIGGGEYRLIDRPERLPHSYTLQATKR